MKIPKSVAAFRAWAKKTRVSASEIQLVAASVAYNEAVARVGGFDGKNGGFLDARLRDIIEIACDETVKRWQRGGNVAPVEKDHVRKGKKDVGA